MYWCRYWEFVVLEFLISGSGVIMFWKKFVVKCFVVFF